MSRICVVGGGAREVAITRAIKRSPQCSALFCFASSINPAISELCTEYKVGKIDSPGEVVDFCKSSNVTLVFIGPEAPLAAGVVDALSAAGIGAVGPTKAVAQVESSKEFCRKIMTDYGVPGNPKYRSFRNKDGLEDYIVRELGGEYVVKADGLCGGKGVKVSGEHLKDFGEALQFCEEIWSKGECAVIEEKFIGQEFSLMSFCDGVNLAHMPPVQDHKRAYVGDTGPNTGGMGSYTCADHMMPFMTAQDLKTAQAINQAMADALKKWSGGTGFRGILYGAYMCTKRGVGCIEFNARFGDPESINLLSLLRSDIVTIMQVTVITNKRHTRHLCCVVLCGLHTVSAHAFVLSAHMNLIICMSACCRDSCLSGCHALALQKTRSLGWRRSIDAHCASTRPKPCKYTSSKSIIVNAKAWM
jgi:phosphoribosylamine--glycine ligase